MFTSSDDLVQFLFESRNTPASMLFQVFNVFAELAGYVLIVSFVYVAWDKKLAFRLVLIAIGSMLITHTLKSLIANPRPFVAEGTWAEKWAVTPAKAESLVSEFSTPSGSGVTGSAFYVTLLTSMRHRVLTIAAIAIILLSGMARPYIGVHYVEDVLLGWCIGTSLALLLVRYGERIALPWNRLSLAKQVSLILILSLCIWVGTRVAYADNPHGQPLELLNYLGLLSGAVFAYRFEGERISFDPRSLSLGVRLIRFAIIVSLLVGTLAILDPLFALLGDDSSVQGNILRFLRYAAASVVGFLLAPYLFVRFSLAERTLQ